MTVSYNARVKRAYLSVRQMNLACEHDLRAFDHSIFARWRYYIDEH